MATIHLIYPHGDRVSCPDAIGRNLGKRLEKKYQVKYHNWDEFGIIHPDPEDVLLGHPHPIPWTIFRRSAKQPGWRRVIALSPYNHDAKQVAFIDSIIRHCDLYFAITGNYWYQSVGQSDFSHWLPKMIHIDLAVDRDDFPVVKTRFNRPGERRFLYIGHSGWTKNPGYLSAIAKALPEIEIAWMGTGKEGINGLNPLGFQDFQTERARQLVAEYDFTLNVSRADANPATVLEAMAWGLVPVCTPQSGYIGYPGIVNIPLNNLEETAMILRKLEMLPETKLREMQATNWSLLKDHFNWDRFAEQVISAIESNTAPECGHEPLVRRFGIVCAEITSPYALYRPRMLKAMMHTILRQMRQQRKCRDLQNLFN